MRYAERFKPGILRGASRFEIAPVGKGRAVTLPLSRALSHPSTFRSFGRLEALPRLPLGSLSVRCLEPAEGWRARTPSKDSLLLTHPDKGSLGGPAAGSNPIEGSLSRGEGRQPMHPSSRGVRPGNAGVSPAFPGAGETPAFPGRGHADRLPPSRPMNHREITSGGAVSFPSCAQRVASRAGSS